MTTTPLPDNRSLAARASSGRKVRRRPYDLGLLAPVGAAAFTTSWVVLSAVSDGYQMWDISVRPYSSVAQPISGLGLGSTAPWMNAAFVVCGVLVSVGTWSAMRSWAEGRPRLLRWARPLVAATGVGMAVCGIFDLESILLHTLGFVVSFGGSGVGFVLAARALRGGPHRALARWLRVAGPAGLLGMVAFMATFDAAAAGSNVGHAGLLERVLVTVLMISVGAVGLSGTRRSAGPPDGHGTADRPATGSRAAAGAVER